MAREVPGLRCDTYPHAIALRKITFSRKLRRIESHNFRSQEKESTLPLGRQTSPSGTVRRAIRKRKAVTVDLQIEGNPESRPARYPGMSPSSLEYYETQARQAHDSRFPTTVRNPPTCHSVETALTVRFAFGSMLHPQWPEERLNFEQVSGCLPMGHRGDAGRPQTSTRRVSQRNATRVTQLSPAAQDPPGRPCPMLESAPKLRP